MTWKPSRELVEAAVRMDVLGKELFGRAAVNDTEDGRPNLAWICDPLKMLRAFGLGDPDHIHVSVDPRRVAAALEAVGIGDNVFRWERDTVLFDFLERMAHDLRNYTDLEDLFFTVIPEPGYPWPCEGDAYFSIRAKGLVESPDPPWLIDVQLDPATVGAGEDLVVRGADLCQLVPVDAGYQTGAVHGEFSDGTYYIVSHAVSPRSTERLAPSDPDAWRLAGQQVRQCGGLLFASLAVGEVPATNFSPCVLIADAGLPLSSMRPYKQRGAYPIITYDTDAWTGATATFMRDAAISAFEQLHGHSDYMYNIDTTIWVLGPQSSPPGLGDFEPKMIKSSSRLRTAVKKRAKVWSRDLTPKRIRKLHDTLAMKADWYGYLEAKSAGVITERLFPMAVCPAEMEPMFRSFLDAIDYSGHLVTLELPRFMHAPVFGEYFGDGSQTDAALAEAAGVSPAALDDYDTKRAAVTWALIQYGYMVADAVREVGVAVAVEG